MESWMNSLTNACCSSAQQFADMAAVTEDIHRKEEVHKARLEAGAAANISQQKLLEEQIRLLKKQNETLTDNYNKLKELYEAQAQAAEEAQKDLHHSRVFNRWMMAIAVVSMVTTIAGLIITII